MPAIYAHEKFGNLVYKKLSEEDKAIVDKYPVAYRIGLQGPDYMYLYHLCSIYHEQDAYIFINNALQVIEKYGVDSSQYSYILGFICHFALDDFCHPYVNYSMRQAGCTHAEIENELDRCLIEQDGYKPHKYPLHKLIPTDLDTAKCISPFYSELTDEEIRKCLKKMKFTKHFFYMPHFFKRLFVNFVMRVKSRNKGFNPNIIYPNANERCKDEMDHLVRALYGTVSHALNLIEKFKSAKDGGILSDDFHKDFYGTKMN